MVKAYKIYHSDGSSIVSARSQDEAVDFYQNVMGFDDLEKVEEITDLNSKVIEDGQEKTINQLICESVYIPDLLTLGGMEGNL